MTLARCSSSAALPLKYSASRPWPAILRLDLLDVGHALPPIEVDAADVVAVGGQGQRRRLAEAAARAQDQRPALAVVTHRRSLPHRRSYHRRRHARSTLTLLTVHAHPDDETISTGGVMARYAAEGVRVVCVTCTGGEHGEIVVPELDTPRTTPGWPTSGARSWRARWPTSARSSIAGWATSTRG
jgi:hypothetical protein